MTHLGDNQDQISSIIEKYKNYSSITAIKNAFPSHSFVLETVSREEIFKEIKNLDSTQVTNSYKNCKKNAGL